MSAAGEKMRRAGLPDAAVATFEHYLEQVRAGASGMLPDAEREPVADVPDAAAVTLRAGGAELDSTVVIKLNGGLGTSMGMTRAKSLI